MSMAGCTQAALPGSHPEDAHNCCLQAALLHASPPTFQRQAALWGPHPLARHLLGATPGVHLPPKQPGVHWGRARHPALRRGAARGALGPKLGVGRGEGLLAWGPV